MATRTQPKSKLIATFLDYLRVIRGIHAWRNNTIQLKNDTGQPVSCGLCPGSSDIIGILPDGRFLAIEVKAGKRKVTFAQEAFLSTVCDAGGVAFVARNLDDVLDGLPS